MDPDQAAHCLPVCKNRFEKFARIFSRRHKQTTFSDAGFLGILRVNEVHGIQVTPDKMGYPHNIFLISPQKKHIHVLWYSLEAPCQDDF